MTPPPRIALAVKFSLAVSASLGVLVPTLFSYVGMPLWDVPIDDLTFNAGQLLENSKDPRIISSLTDDDQWRNVTTAESKSAGKANYISANGWCEAELVQGSLEPGIRTQGDKMTTQAWASSVFTDVDPDLIREIHTDTTLAFRSYDSGDTVDALRFDNGMSTLVMRAFSNTNSYVYVNVSCGDESEQSEALIRDALLHVAVLE